MVKNLMIGSVLSAGIILSGCGGSGGDDSSSEQTSGRFSLAVSDAPVPQLSSVVICFNQIELNAKSGEKQSFQLGADANTIPANNLCRDENDNVIANTVGIDLMSYPGQASVALLNQVEIPAGEYSQLRLTIAEGSYATIADSEQKVAVTVPSNQLKMDGFVVGAGDTLAYTLEFDLKKSMTNPVGQDTYFLKPRGVRLVNNLTVGHLKGEVSETLLLNQDCPVTPSNLNQPVANVYLYHGADVAVTEMGDFGDVNNEAFAATQVYFDGASEYNFEIGFVPTGEYSLALTCDLNDDPEQDETLTIISTLEVQVNAGETEDELRFDNALEVAIQ
ncbi:DUF4382 domain-containing protein [Gayadomonas joobiniege]|uniref:DUF4382 domain-containing protein n=1 Tax=Gayadomonas joobiniege TaxID=1234606 RepID=UPI000363B5F1|nr:DUF4382 domain-containing protein [Gayadomonas joobiniege]